MLTLYGLLYRDIYEIYLNWQQALSLHTNSCIGDETNADGWKMHVKDYHVNFDVRLKR